MKEAQPSWGSEFVDESEARQSDREASASPDVPTQETFGTTSASSEASTADRTRGLREEHLEDQGLLGDQAQFPPPGGETSRRDENSGLPAGGGGRGRNSRPDFAARFFPRDPRERATLATAYSTSVLGYAASAAIGLARGTPELTLVLAAGPTFLLYAAIALHARYLKRRKVG